MKKVKSFLLVAALLVFSVGCAKQDVKRCVLPNDNAQHHYLVGMKALEEGKNDVAIEKFERAIYCDSDYSKAYSGLSIAEAEKLKAIKDPAFKKIEIERVEKNLKTARKKSNTPEDEFDYEIATIRVYTAIKTHNWLPVAEEAYRNALELKVNENKLEYYQGKESAHYFMGLAYLEALNFDKAKDKFKAVLDTKKDSKWNKKADEAWQNTDKIVRAMAGITIGDVGKQIAIQNSITKADLAALLVDELKIDKLFLGPISAQSQVEKTKPDFLPVDILNNPFKEEILTILKLKIRGLEPVYDNTTKAYLFKPDEVVKRGEMALILEDVLIKITKDEKLATAFFGHEKSPFADVRPTSPIYNAVMNITTRGIMEADISGDFNPDKPVSGADAIIAIRVLKQSMNVY